MIQSSKFLRLNLGDFERGLIVAISVAILTYLQKVLTDGGFENINWVIVVNTGGLALIGYLLKNLLTNSNQQLGKKETKQ